MNEITITRIFIKKKSYLPKKNLKKGSKAFRILEEILISLRISILNWTANIVKNLSKLKTNLYGTQTKKVYQK